MPLSAIPSPVDGKPLPDDASAPLTLDAASAIALMDDSTELYQEIAQAYLQEIAELWSTLERMLEHSQLGDATRTLHTFKGLSLTVGANYLSEICKQCESKMKSLPGQTLDASVRVSMKEALETAVAQTQVALLAVLAALDCGATPNQQAPVTPAPDLLADMYRLRALLADSDMQALDLHASLCLRYPARQDALLKLSQAIKIFDFARAVVQCDELIHNINHTSR